MPTASGFLRLIRSFRQSYPCHVSYYRHSGPLETVRRVGERRRTWCREVGMENAKLSLSPNPNPRPGEKGGTLLSSPFFGTCVHYVGPFDLARKELILYIH